MNVTLTDGAAAQQLDLSDYTDEGTKGFSLVVQNLGPGDVFFDRFSSVDGGSGVKIAANGFWEFDLNVVPKLYFAADGGDADLRFSAVG